MGCGSAELVDAVFHREAKAESKEAEAIKHPERSWNETSQLEMFHNPMVLHRKIGETPGHLQSTKAWVSTHSWQAPAPEPEVEEVKFTPPQRAGAQVWRGQ